MFSQYACWYLMFLEYYDDEDSFIYMLRLSLHLLVGQLHPLLPISCRITAANARKSPGYAIDSIALYDDDPFTEQEGYQVQENPFSKAMKDETYASPGSVNPVYLEMEEELGTYDKQLADLEETLANYQSGDYYESGKKSDKKPFF